MRPISLKYPKIPQFALTPRSNLQRAMTAVVIALASAAVALIAANVPPLDDAAIKIDDAVYDSFFKRRPPESQILGNIVIVTVDDGSIQKMSANLGLRFPWPRQCWGQLATYLQNCGARVVAFDLLFDQPSPDDKEPDDKMFADALDQLSIPVIQSKKSGSSGQESKFWPPVSKPQTFGRVDVIEDLPVREYKPFVGDEPSMAVQCVRAFGGPIPDWAHATFRLHYYGPNVSADGKTTFKYVPAYEALMLSQPDAPKKIGGWSADDFRGKIVLVGSTATSYFDLKSSPYSRFFPGIEIHATAISNMLDDRHVRAVEIGVTLCIAFLASLIAAAGSLLPRNRWLKVMTLPIAVVVAFALGYLLFVGGYNIYWLHMSTPLFACILATVGGLAWTYLVEDRQRRALRGFLGQYVSPDVANELDELENISLGGQKRELTMLFTDIAGFTNVSERLSSEKLEEFMNLYLSEMSGIVFDCQGTLDKYIGDAIMCFWNAPKPQENHAILACRAALNMHHREVELRERLDEFCKEAAAKSSVPNNDITDDHAAHVPTSVHTRIGVNTGMVNVGNYGSPRKVMYTAVGDQVNLASRLEGANKIYNSHILVAESTVQQTNGKFVFRRVDYLCVKGRTEAIYVYDILCEAPGDEQARQLARDYQAAWSAYAQQKWDLAERMFVALSADFPQDGPSQIMLERVREYRTIKMPDNWEGSYIAKDK